MKDHFEEVLELQSDYSSSNTPSMQRRGLIIRDMISSGIRSIGLRIQGELKIPASDLIVEGKDGTGLKSKVPWVRFGSRSASPRANIGWYCVFLFKPDGEGVYLCLSHASTTLRGAEFVPRPEAEMKTLMAWSRSHLAVDIEADNLLVDIDLGSVNQLTKAYEKTTSVAKLYDKISIPSDEEIFDDIVRFAGMLSKIYRAEEMGRTPDEPKLQIEQLDAEIRSITRGAASAGKGQGFGLSAKERHAVDRHAMNRAMDYLKMIGYETEDKSANSSYDILAKLSGKELFVEVKGTTGNGLSILVTRNEVALHKEKHPNKMVIIIKLIELEEVSGIHKASGGEIDVFMPWEIQDDCLEPTAFQYKIK